ncbi:MAG: glycosyltransferase family 2 protein, partial [Flavobacteriales bacterium]|nr:glycosyltransferase family 2 protein [Flavobacteriales bacterium]
MRNGFDAYGIEKSLAYYRIVGRSNKLKVIRGVWRAYRDSEKLS